MITVQHSSGTVEFPDGTPEAEMTMAMKKLDAEVAAKSQSDEHKQNTLKEFISLPGKLADAMATRKAELEDKSKKAGGLIHMDPSEAKELMVFRVFPAVTEQIVPSAEEAAGMAARNIPTAIAQRIGDKARFPGSGRIAGAIVAPISDAFTSLVMNQPITYGQLAADVVGGFSRTPSLKGAAKDEVLKSIHSQMANNAAASAIQQLTDNKSIDVAKVGKAATMGGVGVLAAKALDTGKVAKDRAIEAADRFEVQKSIDDAAEAGYPIHTGKVVLNNVEKITNKLIRKDIGLGESTPLNAENIKARIRSLNAVFARGGKVSANAQAALDGWVVANGEAKGLFKRYVDSQENGKPDYALKDMANQQKANAQQFFNSFLTEIRNKPGMGNLANEILAARTNLAKAHLADNALNPARGTVSPRYYAHALDNGDNLTGNALVVARTEKSNLLKERQTGSLLSRTLTLAKIAADKLQETPPLQQFAKTAPNFDSRATITADAARMGIAQTGRQDEPSYTDEHGNTYPIKNLPGLGRGVIMNGKFHPIED